MSFNAVLKKLPAQKFFRIHRSYIVNIDFVTSHQKNKLTVAGERLPIGETYKGDILKRFGM